VNGRKPFAFVVCDPGDAWIMASTPHGRVKVRCGELVEPGDPPGVLLHLLFIDAQSPRRLPVLLVLRLDTGLEQNLRLYPLNGSDDRGMPVRHVKGTAGKFGKVWLSGGETHLRWWCGI
jgi:hypothetical protein